MTGIDLNQHNTCVFRGGNSTGSLAVCEWNQIKKRDPRLNQFSTLSDSAERRPSYTNYLFSLCKSCNVIKQISARHLVLCGARAAPRLR